MTKILLVEDSEDDAALLQAHLVIHGFEAEIVRVEDEVTMRRALRDTFDIVLSDYNVPGFGAPEALRIAQEGGSDLPFIMVSGKVGEQAAVAMMRAGAKDYVMKGQLLRLIPAIRREVNEAALRAQKRAAEKSLDELRQRLRATFEKAPVGVAHISMDGRFLAANERAAALLGVRVEKLVGTLGFDWVHPDERQASRETLALIRSGGTRHVERERRLVRQDGQVVEVQTAASVVTAEDGSPLFMIAVLQDISDRKRAEREVREEASLLAATLEASEDAIIAAVSNGRFSRTTSDSARCGDFATNPSFAMPGRPTERRRITFFIPSG